MSKIINEVNGVPKSVTYPAGRVFGNEVTVNVTRCNNPDDNATLIYCHHPVEGTLTGWTVDYSKFVPLEGYDPISKPLNNVIQQELLEQVNPVEESAEPAPVIPVINDTNNECNDISCIIEADIDICRNNIPKDTYYRNNGCVIDKSYNYGKIRGTNLDGVPNENIGSSKLFLNCITNIDDKDGTDDAIRQCIANMQNNGGFLQRAKEEIASLNPIVALRTLQRFGFNMIKGQHTVHGTINVPEGAQDWLCRQSSSLQRSFSTPIGKQTGTYLSMLVEFVRANPGLLNSHIKSETNDGVIITELPQDRQMLLGIISPHNSHNSNRFDFDAIQQQIKQNRELHGKVFELSTHGLVSPIGISVMGGGSSTTIMRGGAATIKTIETPSGAKMIQHIFDNICSRLRSHRKQIVSEDKEKIQSFIDKLADKEEEILRVLHAMEKYNELLRSSGDYSRGDISLDGLRTYVDKHQHLINDQLNLSSYLAKVLGKIENNLIALKKIE